MNPHANPAPWTLVWLRSGPELAPLRRHLRHQGGRLLALAPWRIVPRRDAASRQALATALAAPRVVFTSPAAVAAADALLPLAGHAAGTTVLAVGAGTARALHRAGIARVLVPERMDSEGLLALPALQDVAGQPVGVVTAPDGRGVIPAVLRGRGATLRLAEVYDRRPRHLPARQRARLARLDGPAWLALGSGKALSLLWSRLSPRQRTGLARCRVLAASDRLAAQARDLGLATGRRADSAMAGALLAALDADRRALAGHTIACSPGGAAGCWPSPVR